MVIGTMLGDERQVAAALMTMGGDARVRYGGILIGLAEYEKWFNVLYLVGNVCYFVFFMLFLCHFSVLFVFFLMMIRDPFYLFC